MRKYIGPALAFLVSAGLGASAQSVWPGSIVAVEEYHHDVQAGSDVQVSGQGQVSGSSVPMWSTSSGSGQLTTLSNAAFTSSNAVYVINGSGVVIDHPPPHALYHQVVDRYYDASGQEVETRSTSHVINEFCHSGRRQQDLIVEDDGKGGQPRFVALLMGNEPTEGQKPTTAADKVKVILAANKGHADDAPASAPGSTVTLAANR